MMKYQETLEFHFGIPDPGGSIAGMDHSSWLRLQQLQHDRSEEFSRAFYKRLGLETFSGCWSMIDLASPVLDDFIASVQEARASVNAEFIGFCRLQQILSKDRDYEWYQLYGRHSLFEFTGDYMIKGIRLESLTA